jgi:DivIVA domain-containing protein
MMDDTFRLTPLDIRKWEFTRALRGYDAARVDQFREQVADELERLARLNQDLEAKARNLHDQLRSFRDRDKALNDALVSAQQLRAEIREQAERESQLILREARAEGERMVDAARGEIERLSREVEGLERARRAYLTHLRTIVERQLAEIEAASAEPPPPPNTPHQGSDQRPGRQTPAWLDSLIKE